MCDWNRDRNRRSSILEMKCRPKLEIGTDSSSDWPLISGVTEASLNRVGNLPSTKDRLAKYAIISENTSLQRKRREVGIMSIVEDLAGEELRTRSQMPLLRK